MNLIGRNLIAAYINKHPEAKIPFLLWLKEYAYAPYEPTFSWQQYVASVVGNGCANIDRGAYALRYKINYPAKAVCITWLGNDESFQQLLEAEMKEAEQQAAILGEVLKTVEISIKAPRPAAKKDIQQAAAVKLAWTPVHEQVIKDPDKVQASQEESICSEQAYKAALRTTIANFEAVPGSPAFEELITILPIVSDYEFAKLDLPVLRSFEIVAHQIKVSEMEESYLASIAGGKTKLDNFLAGKQGLPRRVLSRIYRVLGIKLPVS